MVSMKQKNVALRQRASVSQAMRGDSNRGMIERIAWRENLFLNGAHVGLLLMSVAPLASLRLGCSSGAARHYTACLFLEVFFRLLLLIRGRSEGVQHSTVMSLSIESLHCHDCQKSSQQ